MEPSFLDEARGWLIQRSVDRETNVLMQSIIRSEFSNRTLICVDHELVNIMDYDKIAVFEKGLMVEFDAPQALLQSQSKLREIISDREAA